jgi:addiction module RelE/StbE family toxin
VKIRWSPTAERNADAIWDYIAQDNADAADRIRGLLDIAAERLVEFPRIGRNGRTAKTRELIVAGTPYILIYRISRDHIEITRVLHGAQSYP